MLFSVPLLAAVLGTGAPNEFRPPSVPLVTHDPYFSVWSANDRLTDDWTRHWTGAVNAMCGMAKIDGKTFRFAAPQPRDLPAMEQVGLEVTPTRTTYRFEAGGVRLSLTFLSPLLPHDLDIMARPVTYITWEARAIDGKKHTLSLYFDVTAEWVVDAPNQTVVWDRHDVNGMTVLRCGTKGQPILGKSGDNTRIDWGYLYLAVPKQETMQTTMGEDRLGREGFLVDKFPTEDDIAMPRAVHNLWPTLACTFDCGEVGTEPVRRYVMLAYDDEYSIEYFYKRLRPYWRRDGMKADDLLKAAQRDYASLTERCEKFDKELMDDLKQVGGERYAQLCALSFRQCIAAHKLAAGPNKQPLFFSKENFSNGCIATVDVTYPSAPFFLLFNPTLLRGMLTPILDYAASPRWKFPFAPHDLGTYPLANGQVYGGGERTETDQMPVEECGNMLILVAALAAVEGNANYAKQHWATLTKWAEYLKEKGLDPENQLCTDDFAGHLAHNANLSLKAIVALKGYALLCEMLNKLPEAAQYHAQAQEMAGQWEKMAEDGDHYRLTFDKPGTWSQKYNLVWDKLLGMKLFPPRIAQKEVAYYLKAQNKYGLPLDNRSQYTKLDWIIWSATLADSEKDFEALVSPIYDFAQDSPSRVPLTDWYWTNDAKQRGFQARSVVGGVFIKMLADAGLWRKWAARAK